MTATPEREAKAHAGAVEKVEVLSEKGERLIVKSPRKFLSTIERLHRDGRIRQEEKDAAGMYHRDWYIGTQPSRIIPKYDEYISQAHDSGGDAATRRANHHNRWIKARNTLGPKFAPITSALVLEIPLADGVGPATMEQAGRLYGPYQQSKTATGFAFGLLSGALEILRRFYNM